MNMMINLPINSGDKEKSPRIDISETLLDTNYDLKLLHFDWYFHI